MQPLWIIYLALILLISLLIIFTIFYSTKNKENKPYIKFTSKKAKEFVKKVAESLDSNIPEILKIDNIILKKDNLISLKHEKKKISYFYNQKYKIFLCCCIINQEAQHYHLIVFDVNNRKNFFFHLFDDSDNLLKLDNTFL